MGAVDILHNIVCSIHAVVVGNTTGGLLHLTQSPILSSPSHSSQTGLHPQGSLCYCSVQCSPWSSTQTQLWCPVTQFTSTLPRRAHNWPIHKHIHTNSFSEKLSSSSNHKAKYLFSNAVGVSPVNHMYSTDQQYCLLTVIKR